MQGQLLHYWLIKPPGPVEDDATSPRLLFFFGCRQQAAAIRSNCVVDYPHQTTKGQAGVRSNERAQKAHKQTYELVVLKFYLDG